MSFPPQGTMCADCGCCYAGVYVGNVPVCWECDAGEICKGEKQAATKAAATKGEANVEVKSNGKQSSRISEEIKASVLAEPASISHSSLARKYGIADVSIAGIRRQAQGTAVVKAAKLAAKAKPALKPKAAAVEKKSALMVPIAFPGGVEGASVLKRFQAAISVMEGALDAAWAELSVEHKVRALQMHAEAEG